MKPPPPNLPPLCFFLYCSPSVRLYQNKSQTKILLEQRQTLNAAGLGNDLSTQSIKTIKEKKITRHGISVPYGACVTQPVSEPFSTVTEMVSNGWDS